MVEKKFVIEHNVNIYEKYVKRCLDFSLALLAFVLFSPLYLLLAILVRIKLGSPIIFAQERPGYCEKIFKLYKFRTMTNETDHAGVPLSDEKRLTGFGKLLRKTSLDELPELINIIKGNMSIVGPRPLLVRYLPYYYQNERQRHSVRPGLTGLAQIEGRNFLNWEQRFKLDVQYTKNVCFWKDVKIVIATIQKVLKREDVMEADKDMQNLGFGDLDVERAIKR